MTSSAADNRRSVISVQDLLCCNTSHTPSTCPSPITDTEPCLDAFSSPDLSVHQLHKPFRRLPVDPNSASSPDLHQWLATPSSNFPYSPNNLVIPDNRNDPQNLNSTPPLPHESRGKSVRGPWRIEEDRLLIELVKKYGPRHWSAIATHFPRRTGKQARERWMNQLNPNLKKKNWSPDEDRTILRAHASLGNKWSAIANLLPGRTDNSVKNRFNSTLKRAMKEQSLTLQSFDIEHFVRNLHAKPYVIEPLQRDNCVESGRIDHPRLDTASSGLFFPSRASDDFVWQPRPHGHHTMDMDSLPHKPPSEIPVNNYWHGHDPVVPQHSLSFRHRDVDTERHNAGVTTPPLQSSNPHRMRTYFPDTLNDQLPMRTGLPTLSSRESSPESFTVTPRGELVRSASFTPYASEHRTSEVVSLPRDGLNSRRYMNGSKYLFPMQKGIAKSHLRSSSF